VTAAPTTTAAALRSPQRASGSPTTAAALLTPTTAPVTVSVQVAGTDLTVTVTVTRTITTVSQTATTPLNRGPAVSPRFMPLTANGASGMIVGVSWYAPRAGKLVGRVRKHEITGDQLDQGYTQINDAINEVEQARDRERDEAGGDGGDILYSGCVNNVPPPSAIVERKQEADEFYAAIHPPGASADERHVRAQPFRTNLSTLRSWVNPA